MWLRKLWAVLKLDTTPTKNRSSANLRRAQLEILEDRTVPSFSPAGSYTLDHSTGYGVLAADFNADNHLDLAVGGGDKVSVLLGHGDGTFQAPRSDYQEFGRTLAAADFNHDGAVDLVTANDSGALMHLGNGDGTFDGPSPIFNSGTEYIRAAEVGDVDGNGTDDLAFLSVGGVGGEYPSMWGSCFVSLGNGDGTFQAKSNPGGYHESATTLALSDLNGDDHLDLVFGDDVTSSTVHLGNGDGTFSTPVDFIGMGHVRVSDLNNDGIPDAVVDNGHPDGYPVWLGNGDGTFEFIGRFTRGGYGPTIADFNADGNVDLAFRTAEGASVALGRGDGTFPAPTPFELGSSFWNMPAADVDGDGFTDLVGTAGSRGLSIFLNDGMWGGLPPARLVVGDATVVEGHSGTRSATFIVTLSAASTQPVTVWYATGDGTATSSDFGAASGSLMFAPGERTKVITVPVNGDRLGEPNEKFFVNLSSPSNAVIADGQGVGTIADDEPRIRIGDVSKAEGRKGQSTLYTFTVTLSAAYDQAVTMSYRTVDGTATTRNSDYIAKTGTLTFAPGETTKTITIEVKADSKKEANETFYLDLFAGSGNSLFTKNRGLGTIVNDD